MPAADALDLSGFVGVQVPRIRVGPAYDQSPAAEEAIQLGEAYGMVLDPWQQLGLRDGMAEERPGRWAATEVDEVVARQNGKNGGKRVRQLWGLYVAGSRALHTAHEFKTAREHFDKMLAWIEAYDDLRREVRKLRTSHGEEGIVLKSGAELRFVARSRGSGRGFDPDDIYYDEALFLNDEVFAASLPAQSASPNAQRWLFSSAGTRASVVLGRHRRRALAVLDGRRPQGRFVFHEYSPAFEGLTEQQRDDLRRSLRAQAEANPGAPHRITAETIAGELDSLSPEGFDRERLSIGDWPPDEGELRWEVIGEGVWLAAGVAPTLLEAPDVRVYGIAAAWPTGDVYSLGRCFALPGEGQRAVELTRQGPGTGWLVEECRQLQAGGGVLFGIDPGGPAGAAVPDLEAAGVELVKLTGREVAQAAAGFRTGVAVDGTLLHYAQPALSDSVGAAGRRDLGDGWTWARKGSTDIGPVECVTLAAYVHATRAHLARRAPILETIW